ncbi:hypothetical protein SLEP1_g34879 [Rubroshorea leprosula]|uniref:Mechanosensitive ion channel MscS domain-containing protein n=1 Tax=Rubroshorea leprosula TaxID=152421 RepID=A0AAV5KLD8_9ROSI|nr:hypothetical protein SLEP1_g34879 [Rubroshorea leprosula]
MAQRTGTYHDPEACNSTSDPAPATASTHIPEKIGSLKAIGSSNQPSNKVSYCSEMERRRAHLQKFLRMVWLIIFFCCVGCLVASLTVHMIGNHVIWVLKLWQWCVLGSVILCGFPLILSIMRRIVLLIRRCLVFVDMINVHYGYYIYGLGKIISVLLWLGLVLLTWSLLLASSEVKISKDTSQILNGITKSLATFIIGAFLWLLKNLLLNMLSHSFQVRRFDWIKNSLINQHILEVFQSPDQQQIINKSKTQRSGQGKNEMTSTVEFIIDELKKQRSGRGKDEITTDIDWLNNLNLNEMSARTMHHLINRMIKYDLSSITKELEHFVDKEGAAKLYDEDGEAHRLKEAATKLVLDSVNAWYAINYGSKANPGDKREEKIEEITVELEETTQVSKARETTRPIQVENSKHSNSWEESKRSSGANPGEKDREKKEEITNEEEATQISDGKETKRVENSEPSDSRSINTTVVLKLFKGEAAAEYVIERINGYVKSEGYINGQALTKWLVNATIERKRLIQSLKDTKSALEKLNLLILGIVFILFFIVWLLILRILTNNILILLLSQSFALSFMLGSIAKSGLEGIIFVFVVHPFDTGDLCLINGEEMVVEKINLSTTVFRKESKEKIIYPNSVLTTMPIKNFYWGTADVKDSLEFTIAGNTTKDELKKLYDDIKEFMKGGNNWIPAVAMSASKEIEEEKMKMVLYFTCRDINVQRSVPPMVWRRHLLMAALKNICGKQKIKCYNIRPQAVDLGYSTFLAPAPKKNN